MPIQVFDCRNDIANVVIHPELRGRFMKMDPAPAGRMHSHDLGGEIFVVLEGSCEFLVEDDRVTCTPGQLIYVEPRRRHTLHAVGDGPSTVYLSVTPHVDPTHTQYDDDGRALPPEYRGVGLGVDAAESVGGTSQLVNSYVESAGQLLELSRHNLDIAQAQRDAVRDGDQPTCKRAMDELWLGLRAVLQQVSVVEQVWNSLAPRSMPGN